MLSGPPPKATTFRTRAAAYPVDRVMNECDPRRCCDGRTFHIIPVGGGGSLKFSWRQLALIARRQGDASFQQRAPSRMLRGMAHAFFRGPCLFVVTPFSQLVMRLLSQRTRRVCVLLGSRRRNGTRDHLQLGCIYFAYAPARCRALRCLSRSLCDGARSDLKMSRERVHRAEFKRELC